MAELGGRSSGEYPERAHEVRQSLNRRGALVFPTDEANRPGPLAFAVLAAGRVPVRCARGREVTARGLLAVPRFPEDAAYGEGQR